MPTSAQVSISDLDVSSPEQLKEFWCVEQAAQRADRAEPELRTLNEFVQAASEPSDYYHRTWLVARVEDQVVGVGQLATTAKDNLHLGFTEVNVLPSARRRGVGRALYAEIARRARSQRRTHLYGEACLSENSPSAAVAFARVLGGTIAHTENHLVLSLPIARENQPLWKASDSDYDVLTWEGPCPDDLRTAYLAMLNRMEQDTPTGEIALTPVLIDEARLRHQEQRRARTQATLTAAAQERSTGLLAGYSFLRIPLDDSEQAHQEDTLVMPAHRGRNLGVALKLANLAALASRDPQRRRVHTWTAPDNTAMHRINTSLGFVVVEVMHEMEFRL